MSTLPVLNYLSDAARTEGELKTAFEDQLKGIKQIPGAPTGTATSTLTLATDQVTPGGGAGGIFLIDTEAAAATDDLKNILQTNLPEPSILLIGLANAARVVVVKHSAGGVGQISLRTAGDFVLGDTTHWLLLKRTGTLWEEIWRMPEVPVHAVLTKTANYTTTVADRNKLIDGTANTWTLTLLAAATAGKGFLQPVKNSGAGFITIDPNAAETVDGATTLVLMPGDEILLECDGSNWKSMARYRPAVGSYKVVGNDSKNNAATPNMQFDLDADQVVLFNPSDGTTVVRDNPGVITNNTATAGPAANGRDQAAAFGAGDWVYFYWIWNGSTLASISSLTPPSTGPALPSGYTHWALCTADKFSVSSLLNIRVKGAQVSYEGQQNVVDTVITKPTTEQTVSVSSFVPPNALEYRLNVHVKYDAGAEGGIDSNLTIDVIPTVTYHTFMQFCLTSNFGQCGGQLALPNVSQQFFWLNSSVVNMNGQTVNMYVQGFTNPSGGE